MNRELPLPWEKTHDRTAVHNQEEISKVWKLWIRKQKELYQTIITLLLQYYMYNIVTCDNDI